MKLQDVKFKDLKFSEDEDEDDTITVIKPIAKYHNLAN